MVYLCLSITFAFNAPVPERQPLSVNDANACVMVLTSTVADFGRTLRKIELDSILDMKLYSEVQRTRVRGLLVLLKAAESEFSTVEHLKTQDALLEGSAKQRFILEYAANSLKGIEQKPRHGDLYREIGAELLDSAPFIEFLKLRMESKPTVGESVIPAP